MKEEFEIKWKVIIYLIFIVIVFLVGMYIGKQPITKQLKELEELFLGCQSYCSALNETGYVRYEPSDTHYKCFCYSDNTKRMEGK